MKYFIKLRNLILQIKSFPAKLHARFDSIEAKLEKLEVANSIARVYGLIELGSVLRGRELKEELKYTATTTALCAPKSISEYFSDLEMLEPKIFPLWKKLFDNGQAHYLKGKEGNFSNWNDPYSIAYAAFVN